ncbi:hypothetical protein [Algicella marina]|uniref:Uncharacterized protein n=1 Tax=Algicella marina TaxID=2683284 RepID=A0A6P1T545_9RHOB|nr:hypothetical protein [Algicella marina]QHQ37147.1 hypothetical protein GO499_19145 [Algicella marina]
MRRIIRLLLPVLLPSWRFFPEVGPSPRIEYRLLEHGRTGEWQPAWQRPGRLGPAAMLRRLFWNPDRNACLYATACAERLALDPSQHAIDEINRWLAACLHAGSATRMQFRLVFLVRDPDGEERRTIHESAPILLAAVHP